MVLNEVAFHLREYSFKGDQLPLLSLEEACDVKFSFNACLTFVVPFDVVFLQPASFAQEITESHPEVRAGHLSLADGPQIFIIASVFPVSTIVESVSITFFFEHFLDEHVR